MGKVLVIGFTVAVAGSILVVGSVVLSDVQQTAQTEQAEQAMTQLDSITFLHVSENRVSVGV